MKTHFAAVKNGVVVGTRSSASRHVGGSGKFGPYTHAILKDVGIWSWHGSAALAAAGLRAVYGGGGEVVPVEVCPTRPSVGEPMAEQLVCERCGGTKPAGQSCMCFDNNCQ